MSPQQLPIRQVYKGETIFRQGASADHMYIVKDGKVDISLSRDEKTIHLAVLEKGAFFGEMALISASPRSATAVALEFCELYVIDSAAIEALMEKSNPIIRHMLKIMVRLVKEQNSGAGLGASAVPPVLGYAHLIELLAGEAGAGGGGAIPAGAPSAPAADGAPSNPAASECRVAERRILDRAAVFFGDSRSAALTVLRFMDSLNLIRLEPGCIRTNAGTLVERTSRLPAAVLRGLGDTLAMEQELMDLSEAGQMIQVEPQDLLGSLALLENREDVVVLRRAAMMRALQEKGRDFFTRF